MESVNNSFRINYAVKKRPSKKPVGSVQDKSTVQDVSKEEKTQWSKTDSRYWASRLFKNSFTSHGEKRETADWCIKVGFNKRRDTINLRTPNRTTAASKAATFYKDLLSGGWDFAIGKLRPETLLAKPLTVTVGQFIEVATRLSSAREETLETYTKALRRLAAGIVGIEDGRKYSHGEGHAEWRSKVDAVELERLTPAEVQAWKNTLMKDAKTNEQKGRAAITFNSILRNSKALASKKIRSFLSAELTLPSSLWFEGVSMEAEPSLRYRSKIDAGEIIGSAKAELAAQKPEQFKLLLLTLVCGLRRSEADALLWDQVNLKDGIISMHDTDAKKLKSKDSAGDIALDKELIPILKRSLEKATGAFVLEGSPKSQVKDGKRKGRAYRCDATEKALIEWLKVKGVPGLRPIHTMRKEIGSIIASRDGIFKASRYLRHGGIQITSKLYADTKAPVSAGLGGLFT